MITLITAVAAARPLDPADFASLAPSLAPVGALTIDTDVPAITGGASHTGVLRGRVAVFTFDDVQLDVDVTVVGSRPLALLSKGALGLGPTGRIDADAGGARPGPGGFRGALSSGDGGGPGGGIAIPNWCAGGGGNGGRGGWSPRASDDNGGAVYADPWLRLIGGSGGASTATSDHDCPNLAFGLGGGGAVELGALGPITLEGSIDVSASTAPPECQAFGAFWSAMGGGGAGGTILVHGDGGSTSAILDASGGPVADTWFGCAGGAGGGGAVVLMGLDTVDVPPNVAGGPTPPPSSAYYTTYRPEAGHPGLLVIDGDSDGLHDDDELLLHGTDPALADSDGDGAVDGAETRAGLDPTGPDAGPSLLPLEWPTAGQPIRLEARGFEAGYPVVLVSGDGRGSLPVPGCAISSGVAGPLLFHDVAQVTSAVTHLGFVVPATFSGTRAAVAWQPATCRVSQVVDLVVF